jgi:uncharacterized protein (TIRG00374 family)
VTRREPVISLINSSFNQAHLLSRRWNPDKPLKRVLILIARYVVSTSLLLLLLSKLDASKLFERLHGANVPYLFLALAAGFAYLLTIGLRWRLLLIPSQAVVSWREIFYFEFVGFLYSTCIPGVFAGDVFRGQISREIGLSRSTGYSIVFVERLIGLISSALMVLGALFFGLNSLLNTDLFFYLLLFLGIVAASVILLFSRKWLVQLPDWLPLRLRNAYNQFDLTLHMYHTKKMITVWAMVVSLFSHILLVIRVYFLTRAIHADVSFSYLLFCIPIIGALELIPITVGGTGLREAGYLFFFSQAGFPKETALLTSLLVFSVSLILAATGGIWQVLRLLQVTLARSEVT